MKNKNLKIELAIKYPHTHRDQCNKNQIKLQ